MQPSPVEQLIVDLSPAPPRSDNEVGAWAAGQAVFVSSVMGGMSDERRAVVAAVETVGARAVWFESFGGMDDDPEDAYLGQVALSSIYVGVLGARYGRPLKSGYSATHAEYNQAIRAGLRISVWNAADGLDGPQRDFLEAVRVFHTTGTYGSADDLRARVEARLRTIANEALDLGSRSEMSSYAPQASATTVDRSSSAHECATTRLHTRWRACVRANAFGRNSQVRITSPTGTSTVRVTDVSNSTTNALARDMTITAEVVPDGGGSPGTRTSVNGHSPDELTEIALRSGTLRRTEPTRGNGLPGRGEQSSAPAERATTYRGLCRAGRSPPDH